MSSLSAIFLSVCALNYFSKAGEIRLSVKALYDCKEYHFLESRNLRIRVLNGGLKAVAACQAVVHEDFTVNELYVTVKRSGVMLAYVRIDMCKAIKERDPNYELIFASGQVPRKCSLKKGDTFPWNGTLDLYREVIGQTNAFRGRVDFRFTATAVGRKELAYCTYGYGDVKTLS